MLKCMRHVAEQCECETKQIKSGLPQRSLSVWVISACGCFLYTDVAVC